MAQLQTLRHQHPHPAHLHATSTPALTTPPARRPFRPLATLTLVSRTATTSHRSHPAGSTAPPHRPRNPQRTHRHPLQSPPRSASSSADKPSSAPSPNNPPAGKPWPGDAALKSATLIFPDTTWAWQRAPPKKSLYAINQAQNADAWALNWIEAIHWFSFPLGFWTAGFVAVHGDKLTPLLGGDPWRLYLVVLGLLSQVFGGGITGNMMHIYEGWQVAPFRNPVAFPDAAEACDKSPACLEAEADQVFITSYNNAWLRATAYHLLYFFQSFGICLFSTAVYGPTPPMLLLLAGTLTAGLLGPHKPRLDLKVKVNGVDQPVNPSSVAIFAALIINSLVSFPATVQLLGPAVLAAWPPSLPIWGGPIVGAALGFVLGGRSWAGPAAVLVGALYAGLLWLAPEPVAWLAYLSLLAPVGVAAGGAIEGAVAESTFNQWWHWRAFVVLVLGFGVYGVLYWHLVY